MSALVVVCALAVALAAIVVVDGLRLHAAALRRLHQLDPDGRTDWDRAGEGPS